MITPALSGTAAWKASMTLLLRSPAAGAIRTAMSDCPVGTTEHTLRITIQRFDNNHLLFAFQCCDAVGSAARRVSGL